MLIVKSPGFLSTIQDMGRRGYQQYGVPAAGAMDAYALRVANILVKNPESEGCLEITLLGPHLEILEDSLIAITGADLGVKHNEREAPLWESFWVCKGDILQFTKVKYGCRAYLAVAGGFDLPVIMGSKSTYVRGKLGGLEGRQLKKGDELKRGQPGIELNKNVGYRIPPEYQLKPDNPVVVRVVLGPQDDAFTKEGIAAFLTSEYTVTNEADRMGYRLEGPKIQHQNGPDIVSDGIAMGAVQVPGHGSPIIMMADRQTTGGYTKIGTVITPDLWKIAQAKPGDKMSFQAIPVEEANRVYREYEQRLRDLSCKAIPVTAENSRVLTIKNQWTMKIKVNGISYNVGVEELQ